ncbi:MAG: enoyl-CoA hydratase [Chloroflexi bacterium]|nr:enoyl-CoA hydratase [Chloroflexota bacterium]
MALETILYEMAADHVAKITLNRPEARNAQNVQLTYELNEAFDTAAQDDNVKVIILAGSDPHFSSGHDLRAGSGKGFDSFKPVGTWGGFGMKGQEGMMAREEEIYLGMCRRWRNIPKPTIAQVQGKTIAGGLMLAWVCDLIIASDDAMFQDPVVNWGVPGVEYFAHPWELGVRKAKEILFTADWFTAAEAHRLGMVNHVVPRAELAEFTLALASKIAEKPSMGLKLTKEAVNQSAEAQGQWMAMLSGFNLHQLAHSHNMQTYGVPIDPSWQSAAQKPKA